MSENTVHMTQQCQFLQLYCISWRIEFLASSPVVAQQTFSVFITVRARN